MRVYKGSTTITVTITQGEVVAFRDKWPCSGIPVKAISFTFDRSNGDIIDQYPASPDADGDAIRALAADAKKYLQEKHKLWLWKS